MEKYVNELLNFIEECPSMYHAVKHVKNILKAFNFIELKEGENWELESGKGYFVTRDGASIIAFKTGTITSNTSFNIVASHLDSPCFKLKPNYNMVTSKYTRFNTEPYGGMIASSWFDRPLGVAGRVMVKTKDGIVPRLVNLTNHSVIIPNLAIHLSRNAAPQDLNMQNDLLPLVSIEPSKFEEILKTLTCFEETDTIISHDLFLYNKEKGCVTGMNNEFISSPKLDDLECAFSSLEAFLEASASSQINVCAIFDNEEVGSGSNHGAASTFLTDVLERITQYFALNKYVAYANSMLVSADNAHAEHPAQGAKSDPTNCVFMNKGVVVKYHSGLSYTTEAVSAAIFKSLCMDANVCVQDYTNRSDLRGGSTLGHIALGHLSIASVDIGLAQLAMHSSFETAGAKDICYMVRALKEFYNKPLKIEEELITY